MEKKGFEEKVKYKKEMQAHLRAEQVEEHSVSGKYLGVFNIRVR